MKAMESSANGHIRRELTGAATFEFACHDGVACFTRCCRDADMYLYPYDIIRLKTCLGMHSEDFLMAHTFTALRETPYFPNVMLKMSERPGKPCPFLTDAGCSVYADRPYACRAYPLEPAMYGGDDSQLQIRCYLARHSYCLGHGEDQTWTAEAWMADQGMESYNRINARWAPIAARFRQNPFGPEGVDSPAMKMTFMASYNMDTFRRFVFDSSFLSRYVIPRQRLAAIEESDVELLLLGFDWIRRFLFGQGTLSERSR